jgi:cytoskeletal protein CcmA (bactofilin family)
MKRILLMAVAATLLFAAPAYGGDDQVVISGDVDVPRGETLDDVVVVDGHVTIAGRLTGELIAISAPVRISGTVEGDVVALTDRAVIERGATIGGDLIYADKRPRVADGATIEGETRRLDLDEVTEPFGAFATRIAVWLAFSVSSLALGFLLLWLAPRALEAALWTARTSTGAAVGMGLAVFFGLPVAALLAIATLVGIPLGIIFLLALLPLYAIGYTTSAWLLGRAIVRPPTGRALAFLAGWGILRVLALIPWFGGLVWFAAAVFGLGALTVALWRSRRGAVGPQG